MLEWQHNDYMKEKDMSDNKEEKKLLIVDGVEIEEEFSDIDNPTPEEYKNIEPEQVRDLGEAHRVILDIYHPKDDEEQYVVHVKNFDGTETYGTLFSDLEHIEKNFGAFIEYHIKAEDI